MVKLTFDIAVKGFWVDIGDNTGLGPTVFTVLVDGAAVDMAVIAQSARANVHYVDLWDVVNINAGSVVCVEAANSAANATTWPSTAVALPTFKFMPSPSSPLTQPSKPDRRDQAADQSFDRLARAHDRRELVPADEL